MPMDLDDLSPKRADDPLAALVAQDLDPFSQDELGRRVTALEAEISRTKSRMSAAVNHRVTAEGLFKR